MTFDCRAFRKALGTFPTGIVVVTVGAGENARGITVNSFTSVSLEPPLVAWCLGKTSSRYASFTKTENFTISILAEAQQDISNRLASGTDCGLSGIALAPTANGVPGIGGALAVLECAPETQIEAGDHVILIGRVTDFTATAEGAALTYFRGHYGKAE